MPARDKVYLGAVPVSILSCDKGRSALVDGTPGEGMDV